MFSTGILDRMVVGHIAISNFLFRIFMLISSLLAMILHFWRLVEEGGPWSSQKSVTSGFCSKLSVLQQFPVIIELVSSLSILGGHPWCNELLASMCL